MDSTVLAGLIGGVCTITAVIITPIFQRYFETRVFYPISADRCKILEGVWKGTVNQELNGAIFRNFDVDLDLAVTGRKITGSGVINAGQLYYVSLDGSFRNDRFLKMDYHNRDLNILQFGSFIFHLSDDSAELTGKFVGYGHISKTVFYGSCRFTKK